MAELTGARGIPEATLARLPVYLRALTALADSGVSTISSGDLAGLTGVNPAQLRKDLSYLGSYGVRGVGYDLDHLRAEIGARIGSTRCWPVVVIGVGNLGTALASYFRNLDAFRVVALLDNDPGVIGRRVDDLVVQPDSALPAVLTANPGAIGVLTTPGHVAQTCADELVRLGVVSILNFAATPLDVPGHVTVRKVDLGQELHILSYHAQHPLAPAPGGQLLEPTPGVSVPKKVI